MVEVKDEPVPENEPGTSGDQDTDAVSFHYHHVVHNLATIFMLFPNTPHYNRLNTAGYEKR